MLKYTYADINTLMLDHPHTQQFTHTRVSTSMRMRPNEDGLSAIYLAGKYVASYNGLLGDS